MKKRTELEAKTTLVWELRTAVEMWLHMEMNDYKLSKDDCRSAYDAAVSEIKEMLELEEPPMSICMD